MNGPPVLVQKFGGTSVSSAERRSRVVEHVGRARADGYRVAMVVSAMGRRGDPYATDTLLDLLRADGGQVAPSDHDLIFTCGETISAAVMSQALKRAGIPAVGLTAVQAGIYSDGVHLEANIEQIDPSRLTALIADGAVPVITGGQAVARPTLDFTTLGRGGSDTTGVAVGVALGACRVDIFTDVDGVAVADPRLIPDARILPRISWESMHELARFGAKVVHPRALAAGRAGRMPIVVRSTFSEAPGTMVGGFPDDHPLVGLASLPPMQSVAVVAGAAAFPQREAWERERLVMSLVDASSGELIIGAADDRTAELRSALREAAAGPGRPLGRCCWLSVVGEPAALAAHHAPWLAKLAGHGIHVRGHQLAGPRWTCIVPEESQQGAALAVYEAIARQAAPCAGSRP